MTKANDMNAVNTNFKRNLGNGALAGQYLCSLVEHVASSRNSNCLTKALNDAKSKDDTGAMRAVRLVVSNVFPGSSISVKTGAIKIAGIEPNKDALKRVKEAAEKKYSIRHKAFSDTVKGTKKEAKKKFDPAPTAARFVKAHSKAEVTAMIAALQAALKDKPKKS